MRRLMLCVSAAVALTLLIVLSGGGLLRCLSASLLGNQANVMSGSASVEGVTLAAAPYHMRNRTKRFFERATQTRGYVPPGTAPRMYGTGRINVVRPPQTCPHILAHLATEVRGAGGVREK